MPRSTRLSMMGPSVGILDTRLGVEPPKQTDPFYSTPEWRALADRIISSRGRRCEDPACVAPDCSGRMIYPDHIIEIKDGGAKLDPHNILLRCASCHTKKTIQERRKRAADTA